MCAVTCQAESAAIAALRVIVAAVAASVAAAVAAAIICIAAVAAGLEDLPTTLMLQRQLRQLHK